MGEREREEGRGSIGTRVLHTFTGARYAPHFGLRVTYGMEWKEVERWHGDAPHNDLCMRGREGMAERLIVIPASLSRFAHGVGPADQGPLLSG